MWVDDFEDWVGVLRITAEVLASGDGRGRAIHDSWIIVAVGVYARELGYEPFLAQLYRDEELRV